MEETTLNRATLIGRVSRDPDIRQTPAGKTTASFAVVTYSLWRDRNGARCSKSFHHCVMVYEEESAKFAARRIRKGSRVYLEGEIQLRRWFNKDNGQAENFVTEIVLSGFNTRLSVLDEPRPEDAQAVQTEADADDFGARNITAWAAITSPMQAATPSMSCSPPLATTSAASSRG